ncbi:MAG TPA: hypothetical protein VFZ65_07825 [Planctomycetota bacterium]|nr:hypothetical protein [Planctomycetota bacterium]
MNADATSAVPVPHNWFLVAARAGLLIWTGFWTWFVTAVMSSEGISVTPVMALALLWTVATTAWLRPRLGAFVLLGLGALLGLGNTACSATPAPAPAIPFFAASIERRPDGSIAKGLLAEPASIGGVPCRGWVRLQPDGSLGSYELASETTIQGHTLPAASYVWLDDEGRLQSCFLAQDTEIQGYLCRGGPFKFATAFHPDGSLRAFFPREPVTIDGVSCAVSPLAPVFLHPDGHLAACRLGADLVRDGQTLRAGKDVHLDAQGRIVRG